MRPHSLEGSPQANVRCVGPQIVDLESLCREMSNGAVNVHTLWAPFNTHRVMFPFKNRTSSVAAGLTCGRLPAAACRRVASVLQRVASPSGIPGWRTILLLLPLGSSDGPKAAWLRAFPCSRVSESVEGHAQQSRRCCHVISCLPG